MLPGTIDFYHKHPIIVWDNFHLVQLLNNHQNCETLHRHSKRSYLRHADIYRVNRDLFTLIQTNDTHQVWIFNFDKPYKCLFVRETWTSLLVLLRYHTFNLIVSKLIFNWYSIWYKHLYHKYMFFFYIFWMFLCLLLSIISMYWTEQNSSAKLSLTGSPLEKKGGE